MKVLGERISILKKENLLSIVILASADKRKLVLLFLWLLAWSVCGLIVLINYFQVKEQNAKLFIIVYLSFWAYFEYSIIRVFNWRRSGKEKIWIKEGRLFYQQEMRGRGKVREFQVDLINELRIVELRPASFLDNLNQSFWVKAGERLEFKHQAKTIRMAMQLSDEEARSLYKELKAGIGQ